jgi:hypothetical protein
MSALVRLTIRKTSRNRKPVRQASHTGDPFALGRRSGTKRGCLRVVPGFDAYDESGAIPKLDVVAVHQLLGLLDRSRSLSQVTTTGVSAMWLFLIL